MNERYVHLTPRLDCALSMLRGAKTVADVGCDHGRLCAALLQQNACERVIASDISAPSLRKAQELMRYIGLDNRVSFRCGDGLSVLTRQECDAIAVLGMGGTLMASMLINCEIPLMGAGFIVLQPMRAQADIREYLYHNRYWILDDRIVYERKRYYQILKAIPGDSVQSWPDAFPEGFFDVGYMSYLQRDPNLKELCLQQLAQHNQQMRSAQNTEGEEKLSRRIKALEQILSEI